MFNIMATLRFVIVTVPLLILLLETEFSASVPLRRSIPEDSKNLHNFSINLLFGVGWRDSPGAVQPNQTIHFDIRLLGIHPQLSCTVVAAKGALVYWEKDGQRFQDRSGRIYVVETKPDAESEGEGSFTVKLDFYDFRPEDAGKYRCVVDSTPGKGNRPLRRSSPVYFTAVVPDDRTQPRDLRVRNSYRTEGTAKFLWDRPATGGVMGYVVCLMTVDTPVSCREKTSYMHEKPEREWLLKGLKPRAQYMVDVVAIVKGDEDKGEWGKHTNITFRTFDANQIDPSAPEEFERDDEFNVPVNRPLEKLRLLTTPEFMKTFASSTSLPSAVTAPADRVDYMQLLMICVPCLVVFFILLIIIILLVMRHNHRKHRRIPQDNDGRVSRVRVEESQVELRAVPNAYAAYPVTTAGLYPDLSPSAPSA
ncbi:uncharacterized protein LOC129587444 isoform X2 [Paramacrobiotus metropolitanus]|uniref:uncharacterized protein LOC129587444 isoform X2 n=1 Tax=Paramacrobiotus metropolitanus TaxID=2943436 RepID=UPI002445CABC|nr:uncharacterized protein LOC129587444 isoform X2 [Paramacrobiotus metropolitanus]